MTRIFAAIAVLAMLLCGGCAGRNAERSLLDTGMRTLMDGK